MCTRATGSSTGWMAGVRSSMSLPEMVARMRENSEMAKGMVRGHPNFPNGDVYVGFWIADEREGNGQYRFVDGSVERKIYKYDRMFKKGVRWSKNRQTAWLVINDKVTSQIELSEASMISKSIGFFS